MVIAFGAFFININRGHICFEFPDLKLLKKIRLNFMGQEGMKKENIFDSADGR
jgi:hypothetical protein